MPSLPLPVRRKSTTVSRSSTSSSSTLEEFLRCQSPDSIISEDLQRRNRGLRASSIDSLLAADRGDVKVLDAGSTENSPYFRATDLPPMRSQSSDDVSQPRASQAVPSLSGLAPANSVQASHITHPALLLAAPHAPAHRSPLADQVLLYSSPPFDPAPPPQFPSPEDTFPSGFVMPSRGLYPGYAVGTNATTTFSGAYATSPPYHLGLPTICLCKPNAHQPGACPCMTATSGVFFPRTGGWMLPGFGRGI